MPAWSMFAGLDRYEAWVAPDAPGAWSFPRGFLGRTPTPPGVTTQPSGRPVSTIELMLEEGAPHGTLRPAGAFHNPGGDHRRTLTSNLHDAASAARQLAFPNVCRRYLSRIPPGLHDRCRICPIPPASTRSDVARTKALAGAWYEIFRMGAYQELTAWVSGT